MSCQRSDDHPMTVFAHFSMSTAAFSRHCLALACWALLASGVAFPALAADYRIDPEHSYASFSIDHLGFSTQRGQFTDTRGTVSFDPESKQGEIYVRIAAGSIDTGLAKRDEVLRGADWFNVAANPDIIFRSQQLVFDGDRLTGIDGTLLLLGQIRPLHLEVKRLKCGLNLANRKRGCGADAEGVIKRSDFGFENGLPFIGDEVRLHIQVEAYAP